MERIYIKDLKDNIGKEVTIAGWVDIRRDHGKLIFIDLRDVTGKVQMVALPNHEEAIKIAETLRPESVVEIKGNVNERPDKMKKEGLNGELEIEILDINVLSEAKELPFEKDTELNLDTYLDNLPLVLRSQKGKDIFTLQATLVESFRDSLRNQGFKEFQVPVLVGGDAEGGAAAFEVEYYHGNKAYLATSPQLYKQIMVGVFERVFSASKIFRAEKHATPRHLSEVVQMDFEMGFIKDHTDVMAILENVMKDIVKDVKDKHQDILDRFDVEIPLTPEKFPALRLTEAQEVLKKDFDIDAIGEPDLEPEHERKICEWAKEKHNSDFIFITHYPTKKRPFYTHPENDNPDYTNGFDLLFRGLEVNTGGQRIHNYDQLVSNIKEWGLDPEKFSYYLQAFRYGMPPHGGCSTGLERLTSLFLGIKNIREGTLFPRDMNRIDVLLNK